MANYVKRFDEIIFWFCVLHYAQEEIILVKKEKEGQKIDDR